MYNKNKLQRMIEEEAVKAVTRNIVREMVAEAVNKRLNEKLNAKSELLEQKEVINLHKKLKNSKKLNEWLYETGEGEETNNLPNNNDDKKEKTSNDDADFERKSKEVQRYLSQDGVNQAHYARLLFPDMDEDSARSYLSKLVRGEGGRQFSHEQITLLWQEIRSGR